MLHTDSVRIVLLHYTFTPVIGGVELVMAEHARLFAEAGHEVTIICGHGNEAPPREGSHQPLLRIVPEDFERPAPQSPAPVRTVVVPELDAHSPSAARAQAVAEAGDASGSAFTSCVAALLTILRPRFAEHDVVILHNVLTMHFHMALTAALWRLADELPAVRFIAWVHDLAACNPDFQLPVLEAEPWNLLARAHPRVSYIAVSDLRRRQFSQLTGEPESSCRVIPNGVEPAGLLGLPPQIGCLEARHGLLERDMILLHPTRLLRRKNVELGLRVTAAIKAEGRSCACLITAPPDVHRPASAEYEKELRVLHAQLGLREDAFFLHDSGPLGVEEMRGLFALADALFLPSRQEGFGIPMLEAAVHRLPIFCSDIEPLNALLTHGVTTFPIDSDPAEIAALIVRTLDADPAGRARKQTVRTFSWRAIFRNFLSPLLADPKTTQPHETFRDRSHH
ncbi:MAG: hypothetical protein QOE70_4938 [Chthoniobacter sp.]|jgi:glycosyltransferase involved in cell wall biosynthesis|nr:hypothetical protein [Chthoniobacter sp.]